MYHRVSSGWWFQPLWNQLGWLFPIYGKDGKSKHFHTYSKPPTSHNLSPLALIIYDFPWQRRPIAGRIFKDLPVDWKSRPSAGDHLGAFFFQWGRPRTTNNPWRCRDAHTNRIDNEKSGLGRNDVINLCLCLVDIDDVYVCYMHVYVGILSCYHILSG